MWYAEQATGYSDKDPPKLAHQIYYVSRSLGPMGPMGPVGQTEKWDSLATRILGVLDHFGPPMLYIDPEWTQFQIGYYY